MRNKSRFAIYLTDEDREKVKKRAAGVGRNMSDYIAELVMWDNMFDLVPRLRNGDIKDEIHNMETAGDRA